MKKSTIFTDRAPEAIGPYSQAVRVGNMLFLSGQIPLDPKTGELTASGIKEQTKRALENLKSVVEEAGGTLDDVVKTTVYLADLSQFSGMNEVYSYYFTQDAPARATVQVAALPKGALVEIDAVAMLGG